MVETGFAAFISIQYLVDKKTSCKKETILPKEEHAHQAPEEMLRAKGVCASDPAAFAL